MTAIYLYIFLQSNLLEVPFYHWILRRKKSFLKSTLLVSAINSLTHPIVFFVIMNFETSYLQKILIAEGFAVVAETAFFSRILGFPLLRAFCAAVVANLVSWQLAPMLTYTLLK